MAMLLDEVPGLSAAMQKVPSLCRSHSTFGGSGQASGSGSGESEQAR